MINDITFVLFGLIVGFIGGYAGIGGAPFIIVFLTLVLGLDQHTAQGTVLAVMLGPMSLLGIIAMKERVKENIVFAFIGVITYAIFSYLGASFAFLFNSKNLKVLFSVLLLLIGINELFRLTSRLGINNKNKKKLNYFSISIIGAIVGIVGGFFGIGAGVLMTPIFMNFFGIKKDDARILSLLILLPPVSLGAVIKYNSENAIVWKAAIIIFLAYFITNFFGSRIALKQSTANFKKYYGIILILMAIANYLL